MLFESLFKHAEQQAQDVAITDDTGKYTYQQLAAMALGLGMYLSAQTDKPRVGLLLPAGAGFVGSFYGTLLAGKGVVPINFLLGDKEIAHVIADSGIDTVVTIPFLAGKLKDTPLKVVDLTQIPKTPPAIVPAPDKLPKPAGDDLAVLLYTSGTSGLPKGVPLTYTNLQSDVDAAIEAAALQSKHTFLGMIPLFHAFGLTAMMLAPIQLAAPIVYMGRFSAVGAVNAIREHKVSLMFGLPSMFGAMLHLKNASAEDFTSIYAIISGGEPLPALVREKFKERFNQRLFEGYGLTETSPVVALNVPQEFREGSVGKMVTGAEAKIVNEDTGATLDKGTTGEIWLKGPMIMKGYYNLPDETAKAMTPDGYFKTGDVGHLDDDGFLFITGRKKDLIIVSGEKAAPREIEDVLLSHPQIADAAVVGKKDPSRGEVVVAFVVATPGEDLKPEQIRDFCRDKGLAQWKCPREVRIVTELPRNPTGKVLKRQLQELINAE